MTNNKNSKNNMKDEITKGIVDFIKEWWGLLFCILIIIGLVVSIKPSPKTNELCQIYYIVATVLLIYTAFNQACTFNQKKKYEKQNYSIQLIEDLETKEMQKTKSIIDKFSRFSSSGDKENILLQGTTINSSTNSDSNLMKKCGVKDPYEIKDSLINMFRYWQKIYKAIENEMVDDDYLMQLLSELFIKQYNRFDDWLKNPLNNGINKALLNDLKNLYSIAKKYCGDDSNIKEETNTEDSAIEQNDNNPQ